MNITELLVVGMLNFNGLESNCRRNLYNLLCLDWHSVFFVYGICKQRDHKVHGFSGMAPDELVKWIQ